MRKLVCDRCGREIDTHPMAKLKIFEVKFGTLKYDLCPNCTRKLVTFLDRKEIM